MWCVECRYSDGKKITRAYAFAYQALVKLVKCNVVYTIPIIYCLYIKFIYRNVFLPFLDGKGSFICGWNVYNF